MANNIIPLAGRILLSAIFILGGFSTLGNIAGSASYFASLGFSASTLVAWGTGLFELIAGVFVLIGFQTRIASGLLALFCVAAGFIGHYGQGGDDPTLAFMHSQALMKDIGLAGGFLMLAMHGPGGFSVDAWFGFRK